MPGRGEKMRRPRSLIISGTIVHGRPPKFYEKRKNQRESSSIPIGKERLAVPRRGKSQELRKADGRSLPAKKRVDRGPTPRQKNSPRATNRRKKKKISYTTRGRRETRNLAIKAQKFVKVLIGALMKRSKH